MSTPPPPPPITPPPSRPPSIFYASVRSFFVAFTSMIGLGLAFLIILAFVGVLGEFEKAEIERDFDIEVLPNADGVRKVLSKTSPVILSIDIDGPIGLEHLDMQTVRRQLVESREGPLEGDRVKAILLRINTPGGTVADADGIYHAIKTYKEKYKVPVWAYVDGLCASGGMYVASAADKIYASEISLIGSVGVLSPPFLNFSDAINKLGIEAKTLIAGKGKDEMNPLRPWTEGESKPLQSIIDYYYKHFIHIVTSNRPKLNKEKLIEEYGAHVFPAPEALEYGYIDGVGYSYSDTLRELTQEIGIEDNFYQVVELDNRSWISEIFRAEKGNIFNGEITHKFQFSDLEGKLANQFLYLYRPTH